MKSGVYCCYNAFAKNDIRVHVEIPGSVDAYVVDQKGSKKLATDEMWDEVFVSALVRSIIFADDETNYVAGCRRLNPLLNISSSKRALKAFESLFLRGVQLGSQPEIQVPTVVNNYLVDAFLTYVEITSLYDEAIEILRNLQKREPSVVVLIAKLLLMKNEEVKAVQVMYEGIKENPLDTDLLQLQAQFCLDKERNDLALSSATKAVNSSPSEFQAWNKLVKVYVARGEFEQALLTLNSCPMYANQGNDFGRMPQPVKLHLPLPTTGVLDDVWELNTPNEEITDVALLKLPAPNLRSTFGKAYELLTEIVHRTGWDALLKLRSNVFVMEEEYRKEKTQINASTRSLSSGQAPNVPGHEASISEETNGESSTTLSNGNGNVNGKSTLNIESSDEGKRLKSKESVSAPFKNKRLCERWLDNLFMVLYEDLRVFTVWQAEMSYHKSQKLAYQKSSIEWEILGMVAYRLNHFEDAVEAFHNSLKGRFSYRVTWKLLEYHRKLQTQYRKRPSVSLALQESVGDKLLESIVQLIAWNHRWYTEFSPKLLIAFKELVAEEGQTKVMSKVQAKYSPQSIVTLLEHDTFKFLKEFKSIGSDDSTDN